MSSYYSPQDFTPLIVTGLPRAGTRFVTNLLNKHPNISIEGEIPIALTDAMIRVVELGDKNLMINDKKALDWKKRKQDLIINFWANCNKEGKRPVKKDIKYYGYKRPRNEHYYEFYKSAFGKGNVKYIYCIRNFKDHYLSVAARWPDRSIELIAEKYVKSIKQYKKIKAEAPKCISLYSLDEMKNAAEGARAYCTARIFHGIGIDIKNDDRFLDTFEYDKPSNSSEQHNVKKRPELSTKEKRFIGRTPELQMLYESITE